MATPVIGEEFTFRMNVDLGGLLELGGMDGLNDLMDNEFHDKFGWDKILTGIDYKPVGIDGDNHIILEVIGIVEEVE